MWMLLRGACLVFGVGLVACTAGAPVVSGQPSSRPSAETDAAGLPDADDPVRLAVAGLVHGHVHGFLQARPYEGAKLVGVAETDSALLQSTAEEYDLEPELLHGELHSMLEETAPDAVLAFTHTYGHRRVVEEAAQHGVDVMVEKPLAVNMDHARSMQEAARASGIHVLVNYETTWYPSTDRAYAIARKEKRLGTLRKIIVRDGHRGPKEIGVGPAFLEWLTDPTLNGDGALMDFGCYGANLMTWLMEGRRPESVTAVTQQLKTSPTYSDVDDEATIILTYPDAQGIIQASWNWPHSRKDMSIYGTTGTVHADDATRLRVRIEEEETRSLALEAGPAFYEAAVPYLRDVAKGNAEPTGLSSLSNNMIVTEILDAARRSAKTGETVRLQEK